MANVNTFQDLILTLQQFWAEKGCVLGNPRLGSGRGNISGHFLRAIGPERWASAYVSHAAGQLMGATGKTLIATSITISFR